MKESAIESYLIKCVKKAGGQTRKVSWIGRRGAPDRLVFLLGILTWVELKTKGGEISRQQLDEIQLLRMYGQRVWLLWSRADVDLFIKAMQELAGVRHAH